MEIASFFVAACLCGQPARLPPDTFRPADDEPAATAPLVPVKGPRFRISPPDLLAQLLTPPKTESLPGRPLPLVDLLSQAGARQRRLAAALSYWKLSAALGTYHVCREEVAQLRELQESLTATAGAARSLEAADLALDLATATAGLREAELAALAAQEELAERLGTSAAPLPLPADLPHAGAYRTHFDALFAGRTAPPRLKLIDHTLPLRRTAIERRAEAVQAARDALETARDLADRGEMGPDLVAARLGDLARQQTAFLEAVRGYNQEIAEYACGVASPNAPPATMLGMLIKEGAPSAGGASGFPPTAARPQVPAAQSLREALQGTPRPRGGAPSGRPAEPKDAGQPGLPMARSIIRDPAVRPAGAQSAEVPPDKSAPRDEGGPRYPDDLQPNRELRFKPQDEGASLRPIEPPQPLFDHLLKEPAAERAERLTALLHAPASGPRAVSLTLEQALSTPQLADRRGTIARYWTARELAARHAALAGRLSQLEALAPLVLQTRTVPGGPELMVLYRALQLDAAADLAGHEIELLRAEFALATSTGRAGNDLTVAASSPPYASEYRAASSASSRTAPRSQRSRQHEAALANWQAALDDRASALLLADRVRGAASQQFAEGEPACEAVLTAIERQSAATLSLLETLTRYNLAIADYALEALGPNASAPQLSAALLPL